MKSKFACTLTIAATLIASGSALAQEYKTQEQVKAELVEAIRTGDVYVVFVGDSSRSGKEMLQSGAPADAAAAGRTLGHVKVDRDHATRTDSVSSGNGDYPGYDYVLPFGQ